MKRHYQNGNKNISESLESDVINQLKELFNLDSLTLKEFKSLKEPMKKKIVVCFADYTGEAIDKTSKFAYLLSWSVNKKDYQYFVDFDEVLDKVTKTALGSSEETFDMFLQGSYVDVVEIPSDLSVDKNNIHYSRAFSNPLFIGTYKEVNSLMNDKLKANDYAALAEFVKNFGLHEPKNGYVNQAAIEKMNTENVDSVFEEEWSNSPEQFMVTYFEDDYNALVLSKGDKLNLGKYKDLYSAKFSAQEPFADFYKIMLQGNLKGSLYANIIEYKKYIEDYFNDSCQYIFGKSPMEVLNNKFYIVPSVIM